MPLVAAEVVFMLIIVATFAYTIRTILRQRQFAGMLVDFINNMTHEFKTPISTVSLATEAIARPDVQADRAQIARFNDMIKSEVARMRNQAEKILQMAALEEGDIRLESEAVDLHEVIREVSAPVTLQVEHHGGTLRSDLLASHPVVRGDRLHLANIVSNLLDNAVKYSDGVPEILVVTADRPEGIAVIVQDHGIGMRPEEQKQAFHKYYRVPTGNRHDVKGFGLGLSYVKLMVEAHGGHVSLSSRPGEGTRVEFLIPRRQGAHQEVSDK
jgi:two-component system phosphate regulon sensor histidine kinase PhoR